MNVDWKEAKCRREAAISAADADRSLTPYEREQARHKAAKAYCIEVGEEVLTPASAAFLFDKSATRVRAARRENPTEAVHFSLHFGTLSAEPVHMLRLSWAKTVWAEPPDYAERLATVRAKGHVMGFGNSRSVLILSPTDILSSPDQTIAAKGAEEAGIAT
jgi:hypothetical protein